MATGSRLRFALFGLGRLGVIRAQILAYQQPLIELVAVCDTKPGTDKWAAENLPPSVRHFTDPAECLKQSGAEAILICTATATHASLIMQAIDLGLHVMCEKPISVDVITTAAVIEKVLSRPDLKFLVPFTRRYDRSYREAKALIESGELGEIHAVETMMSDVQDPAGHFVAFAAHSGGIFLDMGIHHVDTGRYLLDVKSGLTNPKKQVKRVVSMGQRAVYDDLAKFGDADNAWGLVEFSNGKVWTTHLARTTTNGFEDSTRVCGTKAHAIVSGVSNVEIRDKHGVRKRTVPDAFQLFPETFLADTTEFANAVLFDKPLTCLAEDAFEAGKICTALQHSLRAGLPVYFDDNGIPILDNVNNGTGH